MRNWESAVDAGYLWLDMKERARDAWRESKLLACYIATIVYVTARDYMLYIFCWEFNYPRHWFWLAYCDQSRRTIAFDCDVIQIQIQLFLCLYWDVISNKKAPPAAPVRHGSCTLRGASIVSASILSEAMREPIITRNSISWYEWRSTHLRSMRNS